MSRHFSLGFTAVTGAAGSRAELPVVEALSPMKKYMWLSPTQYEAMLSGKGATPDPYSGRFGLRETLEEALERGFISPHGNLQPRRTR